MSVLYKKVTFTVKGVTPLIMHNGQVADPMNSFTKRLKKFSSKRKKTDEDHEAMSDIAWDASLYLSDDFKGTGIYMPSENIFAMIVKGLKKLRQGPQASAVMMTEAIGYKIKMKHKTLNAFKADPDSWFKKIVTIGQSKIVRTRSIIKEWEFDCEIELDHSMLSPDILEDTLKICGKSVGLGDWRPSSPKSPGFYGRFMIENFKVTNEEA